MTVARELLGKSIVLGDRAGRIVETEAYLDRNEHGEVDLAAHSSKGLTPRTRVIYGPPGHAYVYLIYGMYDCLNLVCEAAGKPGCVLIRALEPLRGLDGVAANGPGKLTRAMGIDRTLNGSDVTLGPLTVVDEGAGDFAVEVSRRIGIRHCVDWPLRFYIRDSPFVSGVRRS